MVCLLRIAVIQFSFSYKLNAKNLATHFLSIFFWIKIDDFKNQCSIVFMCVQKAINVCRKSYIVTFGHKIFPDNVFIQNTVYILSVTYCELEKQVVFQIF